MQKPPHLPFCAGAGRCGHRPLRTTTEKRRILRAGRVVRPYKRDTIDRLHHRFSYVRCWPAPRYFRRGKSSGFANAGRIREIYILRRRGRCPHRPAPCPNRNTPHGADGRYCTGFRFSPLQMRVKNRTGRAKNRRVFHSAPQGRKLDQGMPEARLRHKKERADSVRPQVYLPCCNENRLASKAA